MNCLKCGKEAHSTNVFCDDCLQDARSYPVKPGIAIDLHLRDTVVSQKKQTPLHIGPNPNEQIRQLRRTVQRMSLTIAVLSVGLCLIAAMLIHALNPPAEEKEIGKNYTTTQP